MSKKFQAALIKAKTMEPTACSPNPSYDPTKIEYQELNYYSCQEAAQAACQVVAH